MQKDTTSASDDSFVSSMCKRGNQEASGRNVLIQCIWTIDDTFILPMLRCPLCQNICLYLRSNLIDSFWGAMPARSSHWQTFKLTMISHELNRLATGAQSDLGIFPCRVVRITFFLLPFSPYHPTTGWFVSWHILKPTGWAVKVQMWRKQQGVLQSWGNNMMKCVLAAFSKPIR